jgi:hypothetical protein
MRSKTPHTRWLRDRRPPTRPNPSQSDDASTVRAMSEHLAGSEARVTHWDHIYETTDTTSVGWYQPDPHLSLELIGVLGIDREAGIIDVGGGASNLVDRLVTGGFSDLTVLDISPSALQAAHRRLGNDAPVTWLTEDLLTWEPTRTYDLWHDRAVFHFLSGSEVEDYRKVLRRALSPGGAIIIGSFAPDAPEHCSGLQVTRYDANELREALGSGFEIVEQKREVYTTPGGISQPFTWIAGRRALI